jgi:hypothetical protein
MDKQTCNYSSLPVNTYNNSHKYFANAVYKNISAVYSFAAAVADFSILTLLGGFWLFSGCV